MESNNWRPIQGGEPAMDSIDWRTQLQPDSRLRIVNKLLDTLKKHLPFSGQEGLHELKKIAERFEEKIYTAARSQSDYLRKISLKMLTMETKSQSSMPNSLPANSQGTNNRPPDPGCWFDWVFLMESNNWRPIQGGEPAMDSVDWRTQLQPDSRLRIVNKILDTLRKHLPFSGQEGLHELKKIAERFEEKIYTAARSQSDYLRKISLKMLTMETKSQSSMPNSLPANSQGTNNRPPDPGCWFDWVFLMESNNWRPIQGGEPAMDSVDWRTQLQPDSRLRIVNKIMDTLKKRLPFSGQEGLHELKKIAERFEEKIYTAARSQSDYLRKISLKMLTMETKSQSSMPNSLPANSQGTNNRPPDPADGA